MPELPLKFDKNDKLLIYHTDSLKRTRTLTKYALAIPSFVLYCGMRAIQKRSWWRILLWSMPSFFAVTGLRNGVNLLSLTVTRMHLKSDGETLVLDTALWEGTPRKKVVRIRDI